MYDDYYNYLAEDYHLKRKNPWKALELFLKDVSKEYNILNGLVIDLGCGNSRNFPLIKIKKNKIIGIDNSIELLKIAHKVQKANLIYDNNQKNSIQFVLCDFLHLPLRIASIDTIISIASIHHVKNEANRRIIIEQIHAILKKEGFFLVSVWRKYQKKYKWHFIKDYIKRYFFLSYKKRQIVSGLIEYGDEFIPWTIAKENRTYNRFYHFFSKLEIKRLLHNFKINIIRKLGGPNKKDNFFILAQKHL
jgi:SAM-dependent methyltransferase